MKKFASALFAGIHFMGLHFNNESDNIVTYSHAVRVMDSCLSVKS